MFNRSDLTSATSTMDASNNLLFAKKVRSIEKAFNSKLANIKPIVYQEAIKWLKNKTDKFCKNFTEELHLILRQFLDYKAKTNSRMAEVAWYQENVKILEQTLARKIPVFESEYGMSETTPLRLYDCLVPRIKENRTRYYDIRKDFKMEDLHLKL